MEAEARRSRPLQLAPIGRGGFQKAVGADHVGLDEIAGVVDGAVDVGFRRQVHHRIGAVLSKLEELGIADNTLVIYFNDHGMADQSKGTLYEGGLITPTLAYWPGRIVSNR